MNLRHSKQNQGQFIEPEPELIPELDSSSQQSELLRVQLNNNLQGQRNQFSKIVLIFILFVLLAGGYIFSQISPKPVLNTFNQLDQLSSIDIQQSQHQSLANLQILAFNETKTQIKQRISDIMEEMQSSLSEIKSDIKSTFKTEVTEVLFEIKAQIKQKISELLSEIKSQTKSSISQIISEVKSQVSSESSQIKSELKSQVFEMKSEIKSEAKFEITEAIAQIKNEIKSEISKIVPEITSMIKPETQSSANEKPENKIKNEPVAPLQQKKYSHQQVVHSMKFPLKKWNDQTLQTKANFANSLKLDPYNQTYTTAEYEQYNRKYHIKKTKSELPICLSIVGINTDQSYSNMIRSVFRQKYNNYKIAFIDDNSPNDVIQKIKDLFIKEKENKKEKNGVQIEVNAIYNEKKLYGLQNRHDSIVKYCAEDDIILDVDGDDELIGSYVFQLVNTLYQQHNETWALYLNYMLHSSKKPMMNQKVQGPVPDEVFANNSYRTAGIWKTTALKTFRRKLYMKIDPTDFLDINQNYYVEKADAFIHFSLVELAGKDHIRKIDEPVYFYNQRVTQVGRKKLRVEKQVAMMASKMLTPYQKLESLEDESKRVQNYQIHEDIVRTFKRLQKETIKTSLIRVRPE